MHEFFYEMNSHIKPDLQRKIDISHCIELFGFQKTFNMVMFFYFCANMNPSFVHFKSKELKLLKQAIGLEKVNILGEKLIEKTMKLPAMAGFGMSSPLYRRLLGIKTPLSKLLDFDYLSLVLGQEHWQNGTLVLSDFAEFGSKSEYLSKLNASSEALNSKQTKKAA
jgi:hypothetical protein